jgi:hypothetical protein
MKRWSSAASALFTFGLVVLSPLVATAQTADDADAGTQTQSPTDDTKQAPPASAERGDSGAAPKTVRLEPPSPGRTIETTIVDRAYAPEDRSAGYLAPKFSEERFPAEAPEEGMMHAINLGHDYSFVLHGYFRAPMRIAFEKRPDGTTKPNEGNYSYRSPYLVDDDYYHSGFAYLPIAEQDYTELFLSVGNDKLTGTVALMGSLYSDAARPLLDHQLGLAQGWVTYRYRPNLGDTVKMGLRVKGGAFWDRFGYMPKYDTYLFGRTHQMGEQVKVDLDIGRFNIWLLHGIGTHLEAIDANQGLTLLHYASAGVGYARTVELGFYFLENDARDKRPLKELTDANMAVVGTDVRVDTHAVGKVFAGTSFVKADQATYLSPALEIMHAYGGRGVTENYLGTQSSENGTGSLWNVGFQYDWSLTETFRFARGTERSPLPWRGDLTASLFGVYQFVQSKQASPDPLVNKDDRKSLKWGAELGWRIHEIVGISARYDRVVLDVGDSANSFRVLSPKLAFYTNFLTKEQIFIQYSRYKYNERVRLRPGQVQLENFPDDHVLKVQAQMVF